MDILQTTFQKYKRNFKMNQLDEVKQYEILTFPNICFNRKNIIKSIKYKELSIENLSK